MKHQLLFFLFISFCTFGYAQGNFDKVEITYEKVSESIYMLQGAGGNIALFTGGDELFMIDGQFAPLSEKISNVISDIADKPIRYLANTHWHGDHTGGNENFAKKGATIVAHKNVRERMSTEQTIQAFGRKVPASPEDALPVITFEDDISFYIGEEQVYAFHVHNAHTDGDAIVYFMNSNVIHLGDTYFQGKYPFYDVSSGGSIDGLIKSANEVLFLINDATKIIPGHGKLSNKKELTTYRDMLKELRDIVQQAINKDMSIEEIKAAKLTKHLDEQWGTGFIKPEKIVDIIWTDLTREKD